MKKDVKKALVISILSMGVLSLTPTALCVPFGNGSNAVRPQFGNDQKVYQDNHRLIAGENRRNHVNTFGGNVNTLMYHPGSFDAERFHTILRMNGVDIIEPEDSNKHEWKCEIYNFGETGCVKYIKNYNEPLDSPLRRTIIFSFNPNIMVGEVNESVIRRYNRFLADCGFSEDNIIKFNNFKSITVPEGVKSIGDSSFEGCGSLEKINIPNSVTSIGEYAFLECDNLIKVIIPENVRSIGKRAFRGCENLKEIVISKGINSISESTFEGCRSLEKINIPNSVTSIGEHAFYKCKSLREVIIPKGVNSIASNAFSECDNLRNIKWNDKTYKNRDDFFNDFINRRYAPGIKWNGRTYNSAGEFLKDISK